MKVLFVATRPDKPSYRFRVLPFVDRLRARGWTVEVAFVPARAWGRLAVWRGLSSWDVVVVQKRLLGALELALVRSRAARLVYDFDDAVYLRESAAGGEPDRRRSARFSRMVRAADLVVAGNAFLAERARESGAARVEILPTSVDTDRYRPAPPPRRDRHAPLTIGWSGSSSTNRYLVELLATLRPLALGCPYRILAVSDRPPAAYDSGGSAPPSHRRRGIRAANAAPAAPLVEGAVHSLPLAYEPWSEAAEIPLLQSFDVGIMPLDDTPWTRGKCGMKALLSLAVGAPAVASPVGVNPEIVRPGETGFLARTPDEWHHALLEILSDERLRRELGANGRRWVEERFSVASAAGRLAQLLEEVAQCRR